MGRHTPGARRGGRAGRWVVAALAVLVLVAAGGAVAVRQGLVEVPVLTDALRPAPTTPSCRPTPLRVVTSPEAAPAVRAALAPGDGRVLADGTCLRLDVRGVGAAQELATLRAAGDATSPAALATLPHLWVPDSTLWASRAPKAVPTTVVGSLATSPVVLATSASAVASLGWPAQGGPTWAQAVTGVRPVAVDLTGDTCGLATALALRTTIRDEKAFRQALAGLSLAVDQASALGAPFDLASGDSPRTPLVPTTEQQVLAQRRAGLTTLKMVYPKDGAPVLDYPLLTVADGRWPAVETAAVRDAVTALRSPAAQAAFVGQGFRAGGDVPQGDDVAAAGLKTYPLPGGPAVDTLVAGLATLAAPTRMLAVVDVSRSMSGEIGPGVTKIGLVAAASAKALDLFPGRYTVGTWVFASRLDGRKDYKELSPLERLSDTDGAVTHRERLLADLQTLPTLLNDNGTSIYDTVDAAVTTMQETFDGRASNVVVLLTDGVDTDRNGLTLDEAVSRLQKGRAKGDVRLVVIGIGDQVDRGALQRLAGATKDGQAYVAEKPDDLGKILVEALATRS